MRPILSVLPYLLILPSIATSQTPVRVGNEFPVNTETTGVQMRQAVASHANGDFVVVWTNNEINDIDVIGQRFANDGSPLDGEFEVNSFTPHAQYYPAVATAGEDFVVVWTSNTQEIDNSVDEHHGIFGQRFDGNGARVGVEFHVNTNTTGYQELPSVATDAEGNFVVAWSQRPYGPGIGQDGDGRGVFGQRFSANGNRLGVEFQANSFTAGDQLDASVAVADDGDYVVVWNSYGSSGTDTSLGSVQGQRFRSDGTPLGEQFQVNTYTTGNQLLRGLAPGRSLAADAFGNFVVVWNDKFRGGIFGQRFAKDGSRLGGEFPVSTSDDVGGSVGMRSDGDFVVAWQGDDGDSSGIFGRFFAADATPVGAEFQVNTYTTGAQGGPGATPEAAMAEDGDFVVVWTSNLYLTPGEGGQDGDASGVFGQRFRTPLVAIDIKPGSDPNSINCKKKRKGVIPVGVLSTQVTSGDAVDFDATTIVDDSVRFGPSQAEETHGHGHLEDVDGDGDTDMVFHFRFNETGIACGDTSATLTGTTDSGDAFAGSDSVRTVGN